MEAASGVLRIRHRRAGLGAASGDSGSEFHALVESEDYHAGLWRKPGEGSITLSWNPPSRDTFLVLESEVRIELADGPTLNLEPGSLVSLPAGVETAWHVRTPYKDVYVIA